MEILHLTHPMNEPLDIQEPHVMALGFFDGVHLGHQFLLQQAKKIANKKNLKLTVMTFDPHPSEIIKCEADRKYLTPLASKLEEMSKHGVDKVFVMNFTLPFASLPASEFINQYIINLRATHIVVGFDFTFGYKAQGNVDYLRQVSMYNPFEVTVISKRVTNDNKISSTLIRELISEGDVHLVPYYLGKHYEMNGLINFPMNLYTQQKLNNIKFQIQGKYILPKRGLYKVEITNGDRTIQGFFKHNSSHDNHFELSSNKLERLKQGNQTEITVKFFNKVAYMDTIPIWN
ncbi:adenylyltransferase/cytidyltransferase family protein [Lysinibacillus sp. NPDC098008]|uniref:adenylyltransferase/cytidyltransferase family protein n=2 Tax=unclassified Lysinibacillus TaxID=2636778 RepID=UPI00382D7EA6